MTRTQILQKACEIVNGSREYGSTENNLGLIASLWSAYLGQKLNGRDVAMLMTMLKIARIKTGHYKEDSYIDAAAYIALGGELGTV